MLNRRNLVTEPYSTLPTDTAPSRPALQDALAAHNARVALATGERVLDSRRVELAMAASTMFVEQNVSVLQQPSIEGAGR